MSIFNFHRNKVKPSRSISINKSMSTEPTLIKSNVNPIGMSYWRNINNHQGRNELHVFLSINDELTILAIDKNNLHILKEYPLNIHHTGEGCYFSAIRPEILFVPIGNILYEINIENGNREIAWQSEYNLWQCHTSYDDKVHSATLKNGNWDFIKWGIFKNGNEQQFNFNGEPNECQIDMSGQFLFIQENEDSNRIIRIDDGNERIISNDEGALGHSDCGFGYALGENDKSSHPGALDLIDLNTLEHEFIYSTEIWNMGYVSFTNARQGNIHEQYCLVTTPNDLIKVKLNGEAQRICSNLTQSQDYEKRPKANLCPLGEFAIWTSFNDESLNAYLIRI